ncbi:MAG: hypothetical protein M3A44_03695 [Gammaproteobacteria bacterium]
MIDGTKKSNGSWWQTIPGILAGVGTVIAALAALIVALFQAGVLGRATDKVHPGPMPVLESFVGYYDYRSTPDDMDHGPLIDEQGNKCYQLIGELSIRKEFQKGYSIHATRLYCVTFEYDKVGLKRIAPVEWGAKNDDVFMPQIGEEIIFLLTTEKDPPNRGLVKASISEKTREGKAGIISGTMLYLIPRNPERNRNSPVTTHPRLS